MPPSAATSGNRACRRSASSPSTNSRLISRPTRKKNTAIHRSLTHTSRVFSSTSVVPSTSEPCVRRKPSYQPDQGELLTMSAATAATASTTPAADSWAKKRTNGFGTDSPSRVIGDLLRVVLIEADPDLAVPGAPRTEALRKAEAQVRVVGADRPVQGPD